MNRISTRTTNTTVDLFYTEFTSLREFWKCPFFKAQIAIKSDTLGKTPQFKKFFTVKEGVSYNKKNSIAQLIMV